MDPSEPGNDFHALYSGDGSHPSAVGTQLAAYVFYSSLTGESPVGLPAPEGFDEATTRTLQDVAAAAVFDATDPFTFPWEVAAPDTAAPDTAAPDTSDPEPVDEVDPSSSAASADAKGSAGCMIQPAHGSGLAMLLAVTGLLFRRQQAVVARFAHQIEQR